MKNLSPHADMAVSSSASTVPEQSAAEFSIASTVSFSASTDPSRQKPGGITVIVPTLNESENIPVLIPRIVASLGKAGLAAEILVVDGGSTDGTRQAVRTLCSAMPVRLVETQGRGGLAGDVIKGAKAAGGEFVVVMDADLSHQPECLPELLQPLLRGHCDMTIGSRYVPGGSTPDWPWHRRLASRCGAVLALPFTDVHDPMSGFFAVRRDKFLELGQEVEGFKIGLEILARAEDGFRVREVPVEFRDRMMGRTKFSPARVLEYLRQLGRLSGGRASANASLRWGLVGLAGMGLDMGLFAVLQHLGQGVLLAHTASFMVVTILNFLLNWKWAFRSSNSAPSYMAYLLTCVMAYVLRAGAIAQMVEIHNLSSQAALVWGVALGAMVNYVGSAWFVFRRSDGAGSSSVRWRVFAMALIAYSVALRFLYGGLMDLIPEEAYYWNYSQHLDYGYLDHPPMVAWAIRLATSLFGQSELAVRLPAMLCWVGTAYFVWKSSCLLFDRTTAFLAVALTACLPGVYFAGMLTTPDAFLYLFWVGCVYSVQCSLLLNRGRMWWWAGVFLGLGLLSKYTMGLLVFAVVLFMLFDGRGRKWFRRPQPYGAVLIGLALFAPVILWNAQHGWSSFMFQSVRRLSHRAEFGLWELLGAAFVLATPLGAVGSFKAVLRPEWGGCVPRGRDFSLRARKLAAFLVFVPMAVFVIFSLRHSPKLNWTAVVFLAGLPFLAQEIRTRNPLSRQIVQWGRRAWPVSLASVLLVLGCLSLYSVSGFPGAAPVSTMRAYSPSAWGELNGAVECIRDRASLQAGSEAAVVGMDKYFTSSELAYYGGVCLGDESPRVAGRGVFAKLHARYGGLMWNSWVPREELRGRSIVMVSFKRDDLETPRLAGYFSNLSPVQRQGVNKNGKVVAAFYWRIGYGYHESGPLHETPVAAGRSQFSSKLCVTDLRSGSTR